MKNKLTFLVLLTALILAGCSNLDSVEKLSRNIDVLYRRVESLYKGLTARYPNNEAVKLSLGKFYYKNRDYQKAEEILKELYSSEARLLLAKTYARLSDYTSALDIFERLKDIKDQEALFLYGLSLEKKNLFPKAKSVYNQVNRTPYANFAKQRLDSLRVGFDQEVPAYLEEMIKASPGSEDFPNASSIVLFCDEEISFTKDDKSVAVMHVVVKVLNDKGRQDWGEVEIGYDSTYEKVELEFARTITPDKRIVSVGKENIRDVTKYLNFPLYSNAKAFIISMPEVLKESFIEYKVKIYRNKLINKKDFSFIYRLKESQPIIDCKLAILVPEGKEIFFHAINEQYLPPHMSFEPKENIKGDFREYIFEFKDIPQFIPESNMVPSSFTNPALVVSSFADWGQFYEWWRKLYKDKTALSQELGLFLEELIKDAESDYEKARRIYEFCAEKIRYVAIEYGEAGFEPHNAQEVFLNKYGDCKDQAILLISLLRGAGLKAYPVLIPTKTAYNLEENRAASYFNHAIACVDLEGSLVFMDPTASVTSFKDLPPSDQNRRVLVFFDDNYKILDTPILKDNSLNIKMAVRIDEKEIVEIQREVISFGFYASSQRYYLRYTPPQLIEDNLREKMKNFSSLSRLVNFETVNVDSLDKAPILRYNFLAYNFLSKVRDLRILPVLGEEIIDTSWINRDERSYPLYLGSPYEFKVEAKITLPPNLRVQYLPQDLKIESKWLDFSLTYKEEGKGLLFDETLSIKEETVKESEYLDFKKIIEDILHNLKQQIILKVTNKDA
ncbi:MAG: DUF3857 domain-containing protein [Candidatus Omnitrophica bacterium]|nr:DUF3857 domain-containing protein [Candidatus Omnitrophota bacterium]